MNRSTTGLVVAAAFVVAAFCQPPDSLAGEAAAPEVEEVLVTARKRDESIVDVPISISLVSGEEIERQGFRDLQAVAAAVPAVNLSKAGAAEFINVRGVGSGENPGFEQSVAVVVDGVAIGRSRATRAGLFDVQRVEVLKGPQTTYFGANTIAGVFNLTTRGASFDEELSGYVRSSYEFATDEAVLEGAVNLPVADAFALRLAGKYTDSKGYIDNLGLDRREPAVEDVLGRVSMLWVPNDNLTAELKYTHGQVDANSALDIQLVNCEPFAPPGVLPTGPQGGVAQFNCIGPNGQPVEDELDYTNSTDLPESRSLDLDMLMLNLDYDFGAFSLTSVTGYYEFQNDFLIDLDLSSVPSAVAPSRFSLAQLDDGEQFSQELRISSAAGSGFEWTAGLYYQKEDALFSNSVVTGFTPPLPPPAAGISSGNNAQKAETWSVFGTALFNLTDRLRASLGLRYIEVDKTVTQPPTTPGVMPADRVANARDFRPLFPFAFQRQSRTDNDLLPSIDVQYDLTDGTNVYFAFSQGFKAGGYSLANPPPGVVMDYIQTFDPETVDAYELGLKGAFLDNRLNANVALFRSNFKDRQVSSLAESVGAGSANLTQEVANAAESRSQGIELEFRAQMAEQLTLLGSFTYLDSKFRDFANAPCFTAQSPAQGCVNGVQDLGGSRTTFAPEYAGSLTLVYEQPVGGYILSIEPNLFFTDGYAIVSDFNPGNHQDGFTKLNLRMALAPPSGQWELAFVGRNLSDELSSHFCQEAPTLLTGNTVACSVDPPATFALQARYDF